MRVFEGVVTPEITVYFYPTTQEGIPAIEIHLTHEREYLFCLAIIKEESRNRYQLNKRYKQIVATWPAWLGEHPDWEVQIMELLL